MSIRGAQSGFVLATAMVTLTALLALVGLGVDVGHIYVVRSELQVYADEAAVAAGFELDGTAAGIQRAQNAAASGPGGGATPNFWDFGTQRVAGVQSAFSAAAAGPFDSNPSNAAGLRFVRVQASAPVKLYLLSVVPGIPATQTVSAAAVGGQVLRQSMGDGLAPFAPVAHNIADPNFGFAAGQLYTLRWAPSGQRGKAGGTCAGDIDFDPGTSSDRGYLDVGQGSGASSLNASVVDNSFYLPAPLALGSTLNMLTGQESVPSAIQQRFDQDTDTSAATYASYAGNGRRLLVVAVSTTGDPSTVAGFASFFLRPTPCGTKNTTPCCAEYVGAAVIGSARQGAGGAGVYTVELAR
jgi:hypothetical protein